MSRLFESSTINGMQLSNRFVRSATWEGLAGEDGSVTPRLIKMMSELAGGGVGLIITSHAYVRPDGQAGPWQLGIYKDELIGGLKKMTAAVHQAGGRIVAQLAHAGHFAAEKLTGQSPLVVSDYEGLARSPRREISAGDIVEIVKALPKRQEELGRQALTGCRFTPPMAIFSASSSLQYSTGAGMNTAGAWSIGPGFILRSTMPSEGPQATHSQC